MKIVEYLQNQPTATQKELQEALNETRTHIQKIVKELVGEGKIERKGGKRFGYWEVKKQNFSKAVLKLHFSFGTALVMFKENIQVVL